MNETLEQYEQMSWLPTNISTSSQESVDSLSASDTCSMDTASSQEDSPANPILLRGSDREAKMSAIYGESSTGSFAALDPTMCWRKTSMDYSQVSLDGSLEEYSETWPRVGMMRNGKCYERPTSEPSIRESASFSLPTLGANEYKGSGRKRYRGSVHFRGARMSEGLRTCETDPIYLNPSFAERVMGYPDGWTDLDH